MLQAKGTLTILGLTSDSTMNSISNIRQLAPALSNRLLKLDGVELGAEVGTTLLHVMGSPTVQVGSRTVLHASVDLLPYPTRVILSSLERQVLHMYLFA